MTNKRFSEILKAIYWKRNPEGIKSDFGKTLIIGSSLPYPSATRIAALFSSLSGTGYTSLCVPKVIYPLAASRVSLNSVFSPWCLEDLQSEEKNSKKKTLDGYSSLLFGNGIEISEKNLRLLEDILTLYHGTLLIDATGIRRFKEILDSGFHGPFSPKRILLTPHLGEARTLLGLSLPSRNPQDYAKEAQSFSRQHHVRLLLKSFSSLLVTEKERIPSSYPPCSLLGKAGSGDGLSGYLAGLLSFAGSLMSKEEVILFGDQRIHLAAERKAEEISPAIGSILDLPSARKQIIQEGK